MVEYQGAPCQYCEKPFEENDDIVVCPECGTPYHRACYKEAGHCTNLALHAMGGSWQKIRRSELEEQRRAEKRSEQEERRKNASAVTSRECSMPRSMTACG